MDINRQLFKSLDFMFCGFWGMDDGGMEFWHSHDRGGQQVEVSIEVLNRHVEDMVLLLTIKEAQNARSDFGYDLYIDESHYRIQIDLRRFRAHMLVLLSATRYWPETVVSLQKELLSRRHEELIVKLEEYQENYMSRISANKAAYNIYMHILT